MDTVAAPEPMSNSGGGPIAGLRTLLKEARTSLLESVYTNRVALTLDRSVFSFTFDDAPRSAADVGGRMLEDAGATGTYYIATGLASDPSAQHPLLPLEQLVALRERGHDIQCHTHAHLDLRHHGGRRIIEDCRRNRDQLSTVLPGWPIEHFAYPFGAVSPWAKRALRATYRTMRTTEFGANRGTVDLAHLRAVEIFSHRLDRARIRRLVEACQREPAWVVFYTHDVADRPSQWGAMPADFRWTLDQCLSKGAVLNVSAAYDLVAGRTPRR